MSKDLNEYRQVRGIDSNLHDYDEALDLYNKHIKN